MITGKLYRLPHCYCTAYPIVTVPLTPLFDLFPVPLTPLYIKVLKDIKSFKAGERLGFARLFPLKCDKIRQNTTEYQCISENKEVKRK